MTTEEVKRGLRYEIRKREGETYGEDETNVRKMCIDCLQVITTLEAELNKYKTGSKI